VNEEHENKKKLTWNETMALHPSAWHGMAWLADRSSKQTRQQHFSGSNDRVQTKAAVNECTTDE
jgi:hypothetical protein